MPGQVIGVVDPGVLGDEVAQALADLFLVVADDLVSGVGGGQFGGRVEERTSSVRHRCVGGVGVEHGQGPGWGCVLQTLFPAGPPLLVSVAQVGRDQGVLGTEPVVECALGHA